MAKIAVNLRIDLSKVDESKVFNGAKGRYLDATVFIDIDQADQYGNNGMITQSVTKDEKASGVKGNILGNCKVYWREGVQQAPQQAPVPSYQQPAQQPARFNQPAPANQNCPAGGLPEFDDDIPF